MGGEWCAADSSHAIVAITGNQSVLHIYFMHEGCVCAWTSLLLQPKFVRPHKSQQITTIQNQLNIKTSIVAYKIR
jgi:hypothetical protein